VRRRPRLRGIASHRCSISCPLPRQGMRLRGVVKRRRVFSTGWRHPVENPGPRAGSSRSDCWMTRLRPRPWQPCPVHRWKAPRARGAHSSSRKGGRSGPRPRMCPRERHPEGPRSLPFRGWGRVVRPSQRWSLQPAREGSHDERCPSGSSWVKTANGCSEGRAVAAGRGLGPGRTWLVKPRLVAVAVPERGLGLAPWQRAAPPVLGGGRSSGEASATPSTRASGARERVLARSFISDTGIR